MTWTPSLDGPGSQSMSQEGALVLGLVGGDQPRRIFLQVGGGQGLGLLCFAMHARTHTYTHIHAHTRTHARTHTRMHACCTFLQVWGCPAGACCAVAHTQEHTHAHMRTHTRAHVHTHTHVRMYTHTHTEIHTHTRIHPPTRALAQPTLQGVLPESSLKIRDRVLDAGPVPLGAPQSLMAQLHNTGTRAAAFCVLPNAHLKVRWRCGGVRGAGVLPWWGGAGVLPHGGSSA